MLTGTRVLQKDGRENLEAGDLIREREIANVDGPNLPLVVKLKSRFN